MAGSGLALGLGGLLAAVGGALPSLSFLGSKMINWLSGNRVSDVIGKAIIAERFSPTIASIWDAKKIMDGVRGE